MATRSHTKKRKTSEEKVVEKTNDPVLLFQVTRTDSGMDLQDLGPFFMVQSIASVPAKELPFLRAYGDPLERGSHVWGQGFTPEEQADNRRARLYYDSMRAKLKNKDPTVKCIGVGELVGLNIEISIGVVNGHGL
jgi:hypothetical protein